MVLGLADNVNYKNFDIALQNNDLVFILTDGMTEVFNEDSNILEEEGLAEIIQDILSTSALLENTIEQLFYQLDQFRSGVPYLDDMTIFAARIK